MARPFDVKVLIKSSCIVAGLFLTVTSLSLVGSYFGINKDSTIMLYLLGVLFTSVLTHKYVFGIISAFINALSFNYFFTEPIFTLHIFSTADIILLGFFLLTAIIGSAMMSKLTRQISLASQNEATARTLYEVSGGFLNVTGKNNIIMRGIAYIYEHSGCKAYVSLDGEELLYREDAEPVCAGTIVEYALCISSKQIGKLCVEIVSSDIEAKHELFFKAVAAQIGIALDREKVYNERESIRIAMEKEKLRSTLLRAIAHDLRTPLTSLYGASLLLTDKFDSLSVDEKRRLSIDISEETIWLINLVENILSMTRIDESQLIIYKEYEVIDDIIGEAVKRMEKLLDGRRILTFPPDEVIGLSMDGKLVSQVLINLIENAIKHTEKSDEIVLTVSIDKQKAVFVVADTGEGIPDDKKEEVFNGFVTSKGLSSDSRRGVGLGLAICRAIIEAHGGRIWVEDNAPFGAKFIFTLPMEDENGSQISDTHY